MKAVYLTEQGPPEVLTYGDLPEPPIGADEVLVRVRATALNHLDVWARAGSRGTKREFKEPFILGCDIAGEVAEIGPQVTTVRVGDRVVLNPGITCGVCDSCVSGQDNMCKRYLMIGSAVNGGYADYAKAPQGNAYKIPATLSYEEAAAVPLTFLTAWHMLVGRAQLQAGEDVLIHAAGSGVGSAAIQVAKLLGARVLTTASSDEKLEKAKGLGADEGINYSREDFAQRVKELTGGKGVEVVLDHIGADIWEKNFASLARSGRFVTCGITAGYNVQLHLGQLFTRHLQLLGSFMGTNQEFQTIMRLVHLGKLHGVIAQVLPLQEAARAHQLMEDRNVFGKLVLQVG